VKAVHTALRRGRPHRHIPLDDETEDEEEEEEEEPEPEQEKDEEEITMERYTSEQNARIKAIFDKKRHEDEEIQELCASLCVVGLMEGKEALIKEYDELMQELRRTRTSPFGSIHTPRSRKLQRWIGFYLAALADKQPLTLSLRNEMTAEQKAHQKALALAEELANSP
jgi:hypothetical protein